MIKKALPVIIIIGFALFLASMMLWMSDTVVKSEIADQQTIEQKLDEIGQRVDEIELVIKEMVQVQKLMIEFNDEIIRILKREPETLKIPVMSDVNDKKAREYSKQFQKEIEQ